MKSDKEFVDFIQNLINCINDINNKSKSELVARMNIVSTCVDIALEYGHNVGREVELVVNLDDVWY